MRCPICKRPVDDKQMGQRGSFYPFCSERCRLIDLGRWLGEKYQIPITEDEPPRPPPQTGNNRPE